MTVRARQGVPITTVELERYPRLVDREHCLFLNDAVRDTMRLLTLLSLTRYQPIHADDIALLTGLAPAFVDECLATLQFDGFVRETDLGFQCELEVERMTWRSHRSLDQALRDMGEEAVSVRGRSGSWRDEYFWPEAASVTGFHLANLQDGEAA
jgi:hypothetical protein